MKSPKKKAARKRPVVRLNKTVAGKRVQTAAVDHRKVERR